MLSHFTLYLKTAPRATFSTSGSSYLDVALTTVHHRYNDDDDDDDEFVTVRNLRMLSSGVVDSVAASKISDRRPTQLQRNTAVTR